MKWLPGGWQRADRGNTEGSTAPYRTLAQQETVVERRKVAPGHDAEPPGTRAGDRGGPPSATRVEPMTEQQSGRPPRGAALLGDHARDVDVSAAAFRNLLVGGGISGFLTVLCAAALAGSGSGFWLWFWQIVFGVCFVWFIAASRGSLSGRGFLLDSRGLYPRTNGEVFAVPWEEVTAVGIGALRPVENRRLVHPERRRALELFPADPLFPERHPELERWRVEEPPPMQGLSGVRYRFHLPALSRLPKQLERGVQSAAPRAWVGQYRRRLPSPQG
ncbi:MULTISPECIES: hypothetical protein [unclassified Actinopolyspora]|uniref:hypothetical protein n=1 Tax=unclassified Actinopolyspora TaxID=2639451 RepID=UPI0013F59E4B|nr:MULTISPECIES: hypothetical protein [unclassified Actinopolyspora]NHD18774.1 hypothetical protein [Actinopolyspora sp. BKK2]NHE77904.1 hypothetical protein [Actinopolyspora sp. BKK1]